MILLLSIAAAVCGILCLRTAWRLRSQSNGWRISLGWFALTGALCLGFASSGTDKGVALSLVAIMLIVGYAYTFTGTTASAVAWWTAAFVGSGLSAARQLEWHTHFKRGPQRP